MDFEQRMWLGENHERWPIQSEDTLYLVGDCLPAGKYRFTITDSEGDGLCCGYGTGWYNIVANGVTTYAGGLFGVSETKTFGEIIQLVLVFYPSALPWASSFLRL